MRKISLIVTLVSLFTLFSCTENDQKNESSNSQIISCTFYDYNDIENLKINWCDIFKGKEDYYIVYFYSENCRHCNSIKNEVISEAICNLKPIYFCDPTNDGNFARFPESTIGVSSIDNFFIYATPSVAVIKDHAVLINTYGEDNVLSIVHNNF